MPFVKLETAKYRYNICKKCELFNKMLKSCTQCRCFMPGKVMLDFAKCPVGKWEVSSNTTNNLDYTAEDFK